MSHRYLRIIYSKLNSSSQCLLLLLPFPEKNCSSICVPNLSEWFQYQPFIQTRSPASSLSHTPSPQHPIEHSSSQSLYASLPFPLPLLCSSHRYISPRSLWCLVMFWSLCDFSKAQSDLLSSCLKLFNVSPSQAPKEKRKLSIPLVPAHHPDFTNNQYNLCHHLGEIIWPFVPCF